MRDANDDDEPVDHHHLSNHLPQRPLNKQWNIKHTILVPPNPMSQNLPKHGRPHSRVHNPIQLPPLLLIIKYDRTQFLPVKSPVWLNYAVAEICLDLGECRCAGFDDLTSDEVCINEGNASCSEEVGDRGFAGRDASCKADDWMGCQ